MISQPRSCAISRPDVSWMQGLVRLLLLMAAAAAAAMVLTWLWPGIGIPRMVLADISFVCLTLLTAKSNAILAIRLYQRYAPDHVRLRCSMTPTCSEYAVLAIRRYGLFRGAWMACQRLRHRCDGNPVIDYP